jgi:hypothetical protein
MGPMRRLFLLFLALGAPAPAFAYYDFFYGWSADGSFYARASSGTDLMEQPALCLSDEKAGSTTWPKAIARPTEGACTVLCVEDSGECQKPEEASKWVSLPAPSRKGPHGETVAVKVGKPGTATVTVMAGGKKVASSDVELRRDDERPGIREVYWPPDGGAVAVFLGYPDPPEEQEGYPPPRYLTIVAFGRTAGAVAANARGLKLLKQKDYPHAVEELRKAIAADPAHLLAHYNLACASALGGDRKAAIAELRWLGASADPAARSALAKARTDADLKSVVDDAEVKKLLAGAAAESCDDACEHKRDRCEKACYDRHDDAGLRGCARLCGSELDACSAKCEGK